MEFLKEDILDIKRYDKLIKLNKKENKKHKNIYLWSEHIMATRMIKNAIETNGDTLENFSDMAHWLSIRLKFTSPEVIALMLDFYNGKINYHQKLFDIEIFDIMKKYSITYPEAILVIYEKHTNFEPTKEFSKYRHGINRGSKLFNAYLDNNKIKYGTTEDEFLNLTEKEHDVLRKNIEEKARGFFK